MSTVTICHARGGDPTCTPGDQTGKEVCSGVWWNGGWTALLRPKTPSAAEVIASFAEAAAANENIGYSQSDRNSLRMAARYAAFEAAKIAEPCNCDCSSFATVCAEAAGIDVPYVSLGGGLQNAPVTWTMRDSFRLTGQFEVLTDEKYLTGPDYLRRGDILVNEPQAAGHAIVVTSDGDKAGNAPQAASGGGAVSAPSQKEYKPADASGTGWKRYIVQWGDTLWGLAQRYGTTVEALAERNGIEDPNIIYAGSPIEVPDTEKTGSGTA